MSKETAPFHLGWTRREFVRAAAIAAAGLSAGCSRALNKARAHPPISPPAAELPKGAAPAALSVSHFPSRLHAFVWRNWPLVPPERLAQVVDATPGEIIQLGQAMGLGNPPRITRAQQRRSYITVIKRNWHLLPYEQLLRLLDWTPEQMAYTLREDDFLYIKLGNLKPQCEPLKWVSSDAATRRREATIAGQVTEEFGPLRQPEDPLFGFVGRLSSRPQQKPAAANSEGLRFCYSYFALYGDPLLETEADPYPDGYLAQLAAAGVNGVWLQAVLYKLAPFPWKPGLSVSFEQRLKNLRKLVARAKAHGISVYLYLNEPRSMPQSFFKTRPELRGVSEGDHAALCTSATEVQSYITQAIASICRAAPALGGFFTITGSENLTNCWSHYQGAACPRCGKRGPAEVIAELNGLFYAGILQAGGKQRLIAWDWGWQDAWAEDAIRRLPSGVSLMSVSEWSLPIEVGGVKTQVGEYSISAVGPGPRASRHWALAQKRGMPVIAKIQAANTWELSAVPYIPATANVAQHAARLRRLGVKDLMLGWTLGGYPSPNLEVVAEVMQAAGNAADPAFEKTALLAVAQRRFGKNLAPAVVQAWQQCSVAFRQFPFAGSLVYLAPLQTGPSNLLWPVPAHYAPTMVGFPYDGLDQWRGPYPAEVFISQLEKVANGFDQAVAELQRRGEDALAVNGADRQARALREELTIMTVAAIHFRSAANQGRFILARGTLAKAASKPQAEGSLSKMEQSARAELALARRLYTLQAADSRLGFEASNQYYYVPVDLVEKALNCRDILDRWLPAQRTRVDREFSPSRAAPPSA